MLKNIILMRSEPATHFLNCKCSQYYLEAITKVVHDRCIALNNKDITIIHICGG